MDPTQHDLAKARLVADFLGTDHHEVIFTVEEGIQAVRDLIYYAETYDVTTIRASTPMMLLSRYVQTTGIEVLLTGEGADEIYGGYLYFANAPDAPSFHEE
jgi:asparagine synthase (glutamine-hydrolysing)